MTEYIERQAVLDLFWTQGRITTAAVKGIPAADVTPVRHGRWVQRSFGFSCNQCAYDVLPWNNTPYCPACGAKMDKESQENEEI